MKKNFLKYKQALALKELGFDEECFGFYYIDKHSNKVDFVKINSIDYGNLSIDESTCLSPIYQQAFRFFREKFGLWFVLEEWEDGAFNFHIYDKPLRNHLRETYIYFSGDFKTYEEAEDACLDKLIELTKRK